MKQKTLILLFAILFVIPSFAQVDRSKQPKPGPAPEIKLGKYESFTLPNGLQVFVVENHKLPRVAISVTLDNDPVMEDGQVGYVSAAGQLLRTGTKTRTKDQLDEQIDFIGATLSTSSSGVFAMSLKDHLNTLLDIMSDVVINSDFKQDQLDKIKVRMKSDLDAAKDDPSSIADNVKNVLLYGKDFPYGQVMTQTSVDSISLEKCKEYYKKFFRPNIAYMAVVGDITKDEAEPLIKKYFGGWQKAEVPTFTYKTPEPPEQTEVALVDRPNSVQSLVNVAYPVQLKPGAKESIPVKVTNTILGGGVFRLFNNLREKHAYTYGAYSSISPDPLVGDFDAWANVRNPVTDSSVTQILYEMKRIRDEKVGDKELQTVKNYITGNFAISLENPQTVANFAINTAMYNMPKDYYSNYLKNVAAVTPDQVQEAAKKFILPEHSYVIVVGNADKVKEGLSKFGPVTMYDKSGDKIDNSKAEIPAGLTGEKVVENYIKAIGGKENIEKIHDRTTKMNGKMQGVQMDMTIYQKAPDKLKQVIKAGNMVQKIIYDGSKGVMSIGGREQEITGEQLEKLKYQAAINLLADPAKYNLKLNLAGVQKVNGKEAYKVEITLPTGTKWIEYFDKNNGLKVKEEKSVSVPQGTFTQETTYGDYRTVDGVKYPFEIHQSLGPQKVDFKVESIKVNTGLIDREFDTGGDSN